jgi:hypothetical protein
MYVAEHFLNDHSKETYRRMGMPAQERSQPAHICQDINVLDGVST